MPGNSTSRKNNEVLHTVTPIDNEIQERTLNTLKLNKTVLCVNLAREHRESIIEELSVSHVRFDFLIPVVSVVTLIIDLHLG